MKNNGYPAFPTESEHQSGENRWHFAGMTLRDYFAAKAMQAIISKMPLFDSEGEFGKKSTKPENKKINSDVAESAYYYADAMIAEREKSNV